MQIGRGGGGRREGGDVGGKCCHEMSVSKAHSSFSMRPSKDVSACKQYTPSPPLLLLLLSPSLSLSFPLSLLSPFPLSLLSSTPENEEAFSLHLM